MDSLRAEFEALGFTEVSTFIASGNVIFEAASKAAPLELRIEAHLAEQLGYPVPTFVRTAGAVVKAAALEPFGPIADTDTHLVAFLRKAPTAEAKKETEALSNDQDRFEVHGAELHWLIHGGVTDSSVKSSVLTKTLAHPWTSRNTKSLRKLAAKLQVSRR
jgi:uncharacterized protein (DUF1697 family)